jgi:hypothetical protein
MTILCYLGTHYIYFHDIMVHDLDFVVWDSNPSCNVNFFHVLAGSV